jgi:hypothetical protein
MRVWGSESDASVFIKINMMPDDSLCQVYYYSKEALSTRCGGQGVVIFYGMAKPVRAPQIGPAQLLR